MRLIVGIIAPALVCLLSCSRARQTEQPAATAPSQAEIKQTSTQRAILSTPANTVMTPEYVASVGRFAYIWGWPLVNNLNRAIAVEKLPEAGRVGGVVPASPPG